MTKKKYNFNMIEILLALAVIAIGMTSIVGLFPVGLNASRNAIAENCSADIADQIVTYLKVTSELTAQQYDIAFIGAGAKLIDTPFPLSSASITAINDRSNDFCAVYSQGDIDASGIISKSGITQNFKRVAPDWSIFKLDNATKRDMFFIVQGPNCTSNDPALARPTDYSAMALVWKSTSQIQRRNPNGTWELWPNPATYDHSGTINIELSWPLTLPYAERKKRYYQIVITKPNL